jgi:hypothetical protein
MLAADRDRLAAQLRSIPLLHRRVERVHVDVNDAANHVPVLSKYHLPMTRLTRFLPVLLLPTALLAAEAASAPAGQAL